MLNATLRGNGKRSKSRIKPPPPCTMLNILETIRLCQLFFFNEQLAKIERRRCREVLTFSSSQDERQLSQFDAAPPTVIRAAKHRLARKKGDSVLLVLVLSFCGAHFWSLSEPRRITAGITLAVVRVGWGGLVATQPCRELWAVVLL